MTTLSNCSLETLDNLLSPDEFYYTRFNEKTMRIYYQTVAPSNSELAKLLFVVSSRIDEIVAEECYLTIEDLKERIDYIDSINDSMGQHIFPITISNLVDSLYTAVSDAFSSKVADKPDKSRSLLERKYNTFTESLEKSVKKIKSDLKIAERTRKIIKEKLVSGDIEEMSRKECFDRAVLLREKKSGLPYDASAIDWQEISKKTIANCAVLAFEYAENDERGKWRDSRKELINTLFNWVSGYIEKGEIPYKSTLPIVKLLRKKILPIERIWVRFQQNETTRFIDVLTFQALKKNAPTLTQNFDEEKLSCNISYYEMKKLPFIEEHLASETIDSLESLSLKTLLLLLNDTYFDNFPATEGEILRRIDEITPGVAIKIRDSGSLRLSFSESTAEGGLLLTSDKIQQRALELDLSRSKSLLEARKKAAENYFSLLIDNLPSLQIIALPAHVATSKKCVEKLKQLKKLEEIALHFDTIKNVLHFIDYFSKEGRDFLEKATYRFSLHNFKHLPKEEILPLLFLFPSLEKVTLEGVRDIADDDIATLMEKLKRITHLELTASSNIGDRSLEAIAAHQKNLRTLTLKECRNISEEGICRLLDIVGSEIVSLNLANCRVSKRCASTIARRCGSLAHLDLSCNDAIDDGAFGTIALGCKNLESCNLANSAVGDEALLALASIDAISLKKIVLTSCKGVSFEGVEPLLAKTHSAIELDLRATALSHEEKEHLRKKYREAHIL